jgi:3D (Asp-Asp-Asp) domain-containing protein
VEPERPTAIRSGFLSALILAVGLSGGLGGALGYSILRKDVTIIAAGRAARHTTFRRTVAEALTEARIHPRRGDMVFPRPDSWLSEGLTITVRGAVPVTIEVDGTTIQARSGGAAVIDLLHEQGVVLSGRDKVFPDRRAPIIQGMRVRVLRIREQTVVEQTAVPYPVRTTTDPRTPRGIVRIASPGRPGIKELIWKVTYADGQAISRERAGWRVVREPQARIISIGSQRLIASRGEFAGKEMLAMVATAYSPYCCRGVDNITATGVHAGYGVVAVDPSVIPLGSRLYIEGYGYALAGDTGSRIKGLRIDLGFDTKRQAIQFGRRPVRVYVVQRKERPIR